MTNEGIRLYKSRFIVLANLILNAIFHLKSLFSEEKKVSDMKEDDKSDLILMHIEKQKNAKERKRKDSMPSKTIRKIE